MRRRGKTEYTFKYLVTGTQNTIYHKPEAEAVGKTNISYLIH
jgi:hypothetical protein